MDGRTDLLGMRAPHSLSPIETKRPWQRTELCERANVEKRENSFPSWISLEAGGGVEIAIAEGDDMASFYFRDVGSDTCWKCTSRYESGH